MKKIKIALSIVVILVISIFAISSLSEINSYYTPDYEKINLDTILSDGITEDEYVILKKQTGLSKVLVDEIMRKGNHTYVLEEFQNQNFTKYNVECDYIFFPTTKYEYLTDDNGNGVKLKLPELKNGDIIYTKSTHTFLFRHGHVSIVTDADKNKVLEAFTMGVNSDYSDTRYWDDYPTLAVLRPKNLSQQEINNVVEYAKKHLHDIKYDLFTGIFENKYIHDAQRTHCSHLVWSAYKSADIDIDSNGGKIVLPSDIFLSKELEVIWSYGLEIK